MSILDNVFNKLYNQDTIAKLESQYGFGGSGLPSRARHQAAVNELAKTLTPEGNFGPSNILGKTAAFLGYSATEIPDLIRTGNFKEAGKDIRDNFIGAFLTDQNKTPADIYSQIYGMGDTGSPIETGGGGGGNGERNVNPQLLNQFDNITNTGVAGINIDELDDDRSTLLDRKDGILGNIDFGKLLSLAEILGPTNLRTALAGTRLGGTVSKLFQGRKDRPNFQYRTPRYTGQLIASDFYDPTTGLNRFDRAKTLFGQSRNLMEYLQKKKALANAKRIGRRPTAPSGDDSGDGGGVQDSGGPTGGYTYDSGGREGFGYGL